MQRSALFLLLFLFLLPAVSRGQKKKALQPVDTSWYNPGDINYNLLVAAYLGRDKDISRFIRQGAYVNTTTMNGNTPLMLAAEEGHLASVRILLMHGAGVDKKDKLGMTPLMKAAMNGSAGIVDLLLRNGADKEARDKQGRTPLLLAAAYNRPAVVTLLLERGADPLTPDKQGTTPLMAAVYAGNNGIAEILLDHGGGINRADKKGFTPLLIAVQQGNREMIRMLLKKGANLKATTRSGYSALLLAVQEKDAATARLLLEADTTGFFRRPSRPGALAMAEENKDAATKELLIDHDFRLKKNLFLQKMELGGVMLLNGQNFFPGISFSLTEGVTRLSLQTGFLYRPFPAHILRQISEHTFWQLREYRGLAYAGLDRQFTLHHAARGKGLSYGVEMGLNVICSFGPPYAGSIQRPPLVISPSPAAGLFLTAGAVGVHAGYTWLDLHTYALSRNHFSLRLTWIINRERIKGTRKTISWYGH